MRTDDGGSSESEQLEQVPRAMRIRVLVEDALACTTPHLLGSAGIA
jgi:hypothetical protein